MDYGLVSLFELGSMGAISILELPPWTPKATNFLQGEILTSCTHGSLPGTLEPCFTVLINLSLCVFSTS